MIDFLAIPLAVAIGWLLGYHSRPYCPALADIKTWLQHDLSGAIDGEMAADEIIQTIIKKINELEAN